MAAGASGVVRACNMHGQVINDENARNGCDSDGWAFTCPSMDPWAVNNKLAFAFAAKNSYNGWKCGECYELEFDGGKHDKGGTKIPGALPGMAGKVLIVQAINSGAMGEYNDQHFDIMMPGGGPGHNNACAKQYGNYDFGDIWGGFRLDERRKCDTLPPVQRKGCYWRFDWGQGWNNPSMRFRRIKCPRELTDKSGIVKN